MMRDYGPRALPRFIMLAFEGENTSAGNCGITEPKSRNGTVAEARRSLVKGEHSLVLSRC